MTEIKEGDKVTVTVDIIVKEITYNGHRVSVSGETCEEYDKYFILGIPVVACKLMEVGSVKTD